MDLVAKRFDVFLIKLDPTVGSEIRMARPCVVISPDQMNRHLRSVIVAPMTTQGFAYPMRAPCTFQGKKGQIVLDQIRTVDCDRLVKRLGQLTSTQASSTLAVLSELFAP
jgi:mRNA interferase MazF